MQIYFIKSLDCIIFLVSLQSIKQLEKMNLRQNVVNSIIVMLFELEQKGFNIHFEYDLGYFSYSIFKKGTVILTDKIEPKTTLNEIDFIINDINEIH